MTKDYLEEFLRVQWEILVDLNISINNMLRLKEDKYDYENQIKRFGFFQHHWYQLKFISIIQLAKLFSDKKNDERSFIKLCNILESSPFDEELNFQLFKSIDRPNKNLNSRNQLRDMVARIRSAMDSRKDLIEKTIDARDKIYAHADPKGSVQAINSEELKILIELATQIYNEVSHTLFFSTTYFQLTDDWDINFVLREMTEKRKLEMEDPERLAQSVT